MVSKIKRSNRFIYIAVVEFYYLFAMNENLFKIYSFLLEEGRRKKEGEENLRKL